MLASVGNVTGLTAAKDAATAVSSTKKAADSIFKDTASAISKYWWVGLILVLLIVVIFAVVYYVRKKSSAASLKGVSSTTGKLSAAAAAAAKKKGAKGGSKKPKSSSGGSTKRGKLKRKKVSEGFQEKTYGRTAQPIEEEVNTLLNNQPMAIKDVGFIGPYTSGRYDEATATANVLKAGFRFLTMQVDYLDTPKNPSLFQAPGLPALLIRSSSGALVSENSGSIQKVADAIANVAFRPEVPNNLDPVFLYIHVNSTPDAIADPEKYLAFLSKIAVDLNPLAPLHLSLNPSGNYTRQKLETDFLITPISAFNGQVVILSNVDTSLFRNTSYTRYLPAEDLDFWVNMRVYLQDPSDTLGVTSMPPMTTIPSAVVVDLKRVLALNETAIKTFVANTKSTFTIAMPDRLTNPTPIDFNRAIGLLGINVIPIDIFTDTNENVLQLTSEYDNMPFFPKPTALRAV